MNSASLIRLVALAAIWGASFLLLRIAAPVLEPTVPIEGRLVFAALFLLVGFDGTALLPGSGAAIAAALGAIVIAGTALRAGFSFASPSPAKVATNG